MATEYRQRPGMGDHFDDEDLVMSSAQQRRNWRGILIALMVIVAVLAMIVTSVVLLTPPQPEELSDSYSDSENGDRTGSDYYYNQRANDELWWRHRGMRTLRLSDILSDSANIKVFNGTWISGTEIFYVTGSGDLAIMEIMADGITQMTHNIMSKKTLQKLKGPLVSFELSHDRNHVLIGHQAKKMFRYSKTARYTVYTVSTRQMTPITLEDHRNHRNVTTSADLQPYLLHAQWHKISPTTEKNVESMALIAVYRYDVYYIPWSLETSTAGMVTNIGKNNITIDSQMSNVTNSSYTPLSTPSLNDKHKNGGNNSDNNTSSHKLISKPWPYGPVRRITTSGSGASVTAAGIVSNGVADYLYEMEILKRSPAIWPSSGRYLLYATFDDRRVGEYKYSVYTKGERPHNNVDDGDTEKHSKQRKPKRRKRRLRRNSKPEEAPGITEDDSTSEYYLYPHIRTLKYPKANTPNPVVTLSVIVNLDQLENPQVQPKIRTLTPPPIFKDTDDYYFTAVQWVSDGGVGEGVGSHEIDDEKTGAAAAEVCVVWLNRAQNTSVTTLCKSPMWMCQETQVINAVGAIGGGSGIRGGQGSETFGSDRARRRYRRNGGGLQKSSHEAVHEVKNNSINASLSYQEDRRRRRQPRQHGQHKHGGQHQHNGHHSRRRRDEYDNTGGYEVPRGRYGGWVDATVGGAGGGVPSTGGGVSDGSFRMISATTWWSGGPNINDGGENFVGDDGYAGIAGFGSTGTGAVYSMAALVRKGWETGDKELTPRAPVFAMDGQGYVSVAPVRDDEHDDDEDQDIKGGVRLRRPTVKHSRDRNAKSRSQSSIGKYYAQVVAVNITKKLLAPLTFGEFDDDNDNDNTKEDQKKSKVVTKSWTVVKILAWDQRTDMIYFLAVPSGRGAPHHRHLYAVKFTSAASSSTVNTDAGYRMGHHHQQQFRKTYRHSNRSRPVCLSCDIGITGNIRRRERREFAGKQNRMDEARDGRLRQQQRERWENLKEEEEDNEEEAATAEEAERRQQRNRRQQQREMQNRGMLRHCTYFDAQFSRDGSHYALVCLGPSVPYVTLHRIVLDEIDNAEDNSDGSGSGDEAESVPLTAQKMPKDSSYSFELIALIENNTRLQDKYTNRVLLPGTRTFQLRLSGGRKLTTSGGLHFNDPLAAADYYSNGGDNQQHFSTKKRPDSDPLTVAQVRLYLPLGVYDPEADPRPEFMSNHIRKSTNSDKVDTTNAEVTTKTSDSSSSKHSNRRRRRSSSSASSSHDNNDAGGDGSKQQRRPRKKQRQRRLKKLYPMLVVVNSDPGSQAITDRFSDRLGYTTGLLCSGSLGRTLPSASGRSSAGSRYSGNKWDRQRQRGRRDRRSPATRYYSSGHSDDYDDDSYDYGQNNNDYSNNNEYVVAVIDTGRGTWARGYESLLALNYGDGNDGYGDGSGEDEIGPGGLLGTADLRDQLEAVEYLLSSSTATSDGFKDSGQGYYSEDRPRGSGSRDRSRWFSSTSQSNRRYYSDDDDYYDDDEEYDDSIDKNDNEDYYYYYYSNDGDNGDYGDDNRGDNFYRDDDGKRSRRDRRSASDPKANTEALRLPYVDANKVALLGGGPTSPSTPPSVYGGYAAARMALWQTIYGGAPIEKKNDESGDKRNRKEPVAIRSSFKCAVTMAPVCSWRLYASAFAERYYGYYGGNDRDNWMSYDRSDLIPLTPSLNESLLSPSSSGKGINLLVMHGTADTTIHPQNSMMLVQGVMQQQQQQFIPTGLVSSVGRRNNNSTASGKRKAGEFPTRVGAIRVSQLVIPDADLSNSRMATDIENGSPIDHHHQLLHSIFGHITQYLATECFTSVGDGNRGRGFRTRGRRLRKRRRRWRTGNRDQDKSEDQQQQQRGEEHQQQQQNQRSDKSNSDTSNERGGGGDRSSGGRYRRHDIDSNQQISESSIKNNMVLSKNSVNGAHGYNIITKNVSWLNSYLANFTIPNNRSNNASKRRDRYDDDEAEEVDDEAEEVDEEDDEGEDSNDEYYDGEDTDEEDSEDGDNDDDE